MLARLNEAGWFGMTTRVEESVEAAVQVDETVASVAGTAKGSVKKPGQVVFAGHGEQAGGAPYKEEPQPAQPVPSADSDSGEGHVMGVQSLEDSGVGMLGCSPGPH